MYLAFRDTLLRVLTEGQVTHVIAIQLCLCLVHLAIYLDESIWPQPIEDLCNYLQRTTHRSPATRNILVEFLTLFPEEADAASSTFIVMILIIFRVGILTGTL